MKIQVTQKQIEDIKNEFGTFLMKFAPLIAAGMILVFVAFVVIMTLKIQPDIMELAKNHNMQFLEAAKIKQIEVAKNVTIPTN